MLALHCQGSVLGALCHTWKVEIPKTVLAVQGTCVVIPCRTSPHTRVAWYQYHPVQWPRVYDSQNPGSVIDQFRGRTSVLGSPQEGDCSLTIDTVMPGDDGVGLYVWINPDKSSSQKFYKKTVVIKIVETNAMPHISGEGPMEEGFLLSLTCSMRHSCPSSPPALAWVGLPERHASSATATDAPAVTMVPDPARGVWLSTAKVSWKVSWRDNGRAVTCTARLGHRASSQRTGIRLNVSHAPVYVSVTAEMLAVKEGGTVTLSCHGNGNPRPSVYRWLEMRGGKTIQLVSSQNKVSVPSVRQDSSYSCIAHNSLGKSQSDWLSLNVQFSPRIRMGSSCFVTGGALKCMCQVEANPKPTLHWAVNGIDPPASFSSVLEQKATFLLALLTGPVEQQLNVSCTAHNAVGNATFLMPIDNTPRLLLPLALTAALCGCTILLAVAYFLCCKGRRGEGIARFSSLLAKADQTTSSDLMGSVSKDSAEPPDTYMNWNNTTQTTRAQETDTDMNVVYENCSKPGKPITMKTRGKF